VKLISSEHLAGLVLFAMILMGDVQELFSYGASVQSVSDVVFGLICVVLLVVAALKEKKYPHINPWFVITMASVSAWLIVKFAFGQRMTSDWVIMILLVVFTIGITIGYCVIRKKPINNE
jgi:hypothetical protein